MITVFNAYPRNPRVVKKLIHFTGYIPAVLQDKAKQNNRPIKIPEENQAELMRASGDDRGIYLWLDGLKYQTKISKIHLDDTQRFVKEVTFDVIG